MNGVIRMWMFGIILFTEKERKCSSRCTQEGLVEPGLTLEHTVLCKTIEHL